MAGRKKQQNEDYNKTVLDWLEEEIKEVAKERCYRFGVDEEAETMYIRKEIANLIVRLAVPR